MGIGRGTQVPVRTLITVGLLVAFVSLSSVMVVLRSTCISVLSGDAGGLQGVDVSSELKLQLIEQDGLLEKLKEENMTKEAIIRASLLEVVTLKKENTRLKLDAKAQVMAWERRVKKLTEVNLTKETKMIKGVQEEVQALREENSRLRDQGKALAEEKRKCVSEADDADRKQAQLVEEVQALREENARLEAEAKAEQEHKEKCETAARASEDVRVERRKEGPELDLETEGEEEDVHNSNFDCASYLERSNPLAHFDLRDFDKDPIKIVEVREVLPWFATPPEAMEECPVRSRVIAYEDRDANWPTDAVFVREHRDLLHQDKRRGWEKYGATVLRDLEYWSASNEIRALYNMSVGYRLDSDVPFPYFVGDPDDFNILRPPQEKTAEGHAAVFISKCPTEEAVQALGDACEPGSCRPTSFRIKALEYFMREGGPLKVDSYGLCLHNAEEDNYHLPERARKMEITASHKFAFAFENSQGEDYITEKFFQALIAGSVPVVIGAPNIADFAPSPNSYIAIPTLDDVPEAERSMLALLANDTAYKAMLSWKDEGLPDTFKAIMEINVFPHHTCRLAIALASRSWLHSMKTPRNKPACRCKQRAAGPPGTGIENLRGKLVVTYRVLVRERGTFKPHSVFLTSNNLTLTALHEAVREKILSEPRSPAHARAVEACFPIMRKERVFVVYPVEGTTLRGAIFGDQSLRSDADVKLLLHRNECPPLLEVILV